MAAGDPGLWQQIVAAKDRPDALFVYNDIAALGVQRALLEAGVEVPGEVSLVGFDDIKQASYAQVPLSTVRQPAAEISARAVDMVLRQIARRPVDHRVMLAPELVVRASSLPQADRRLEGQAAREPSSTAH